jgi:basic amino acid/polyamine antiporter, APA family
MSTEPKRELSLLDSVCIIVGIIIGAGIFETAPTVAACMGGWGGALGVWLVGGCLALTGALCYAELATAYPRAGGDVVYLTRAYSPGAGFLFGWSQLAIVRPGDIALMAFVFARYAEQLYSPFPAESGLNIPFYATLAITALTVVNVVSVKQGKWTQNVLTIAKTVGLLAIIGVGLFGTRAAPVTGAPQAFGGTGLALILVLFTFGGWNEIAYVASEVKDPRRNIVRALVIGTVGVTGLYLLANVAFLKALTYNGMAQSEAVAVDVVAAVLPATAARAVAVVVCISALGAVNGLIFTGARITYALGSEHTAFRGLSRWNAQSGTPTRALVLQGALSLAIVLFAGSFIAAIIYTAPVVWLFFLATGLSVFRLRRKEPNTDRPYRVLGFPLTPAVFCLCCIFMFWNCVTYAYKVKPSGLAVLAGTLVLGLLMYLATRSSDRHQGALES